MARDSDSEDIELFRGKDIGPVEQYVVSEGSEDSNVFVGTDVIRWRHLGGQRQIRLSAGHI